ncbi:hypothetical protein Tco_0886350 [Tanacetum coccineum]
MGTRTSDRSFGIKGISDWDDVDALYCFFKEYRIVVGLVSNESDSFSVGAVYVRAKVARGGGDVVVETTMHVSREDMRLFMWGWFDLMMFSFHFIISALIMMTYWPIVARGIVAFYLPPY